MRSRELFVAVVSVCQGVTGVLVMHGVTSQHALHVFTLKPAIPRVIPEPPYSSRCMSHAGRGARVVSDADPGGIESMRDSMHFDYALL